MADTKPQKFSDFVAQHRNGLADDELTELLTEVVNAVSRSARKNATGTLTLKFKFRAEGDVVAVVDLMGSSTPDETEARVYWVAPEGGLTRKNPLQPSLLED